MIIPGAAIGGGMLAADIAEPAPPPVETITRLDIDGDAGGYAWAYSVPKMTGDATVGNGITDDRGFVGTGTAWAIFTLKDPPGSLVGQQTFRVRAKASVTTGAPKLRMILCEGGVEVRELVVATLTTALVTYEGTWDKAEVAGAAGGDVQVKIVHEGGTAGAGYTSIDAIDWLCRHEAVPTGGGGGGGGGGTEVGWPEGWGARPALGSHHGIGQPFNTSYDNNGNLVWYPRRDYDGWLGRASNIGKVWCNLGNGSATWDEVAGGAGSSDALWAGQLNETNPNRALDPTWWPREWPFVFALTAVPKSHQNAQNSSTGQWGRPGIWSEIARGDFDVYYERLFRRLAYKCGQTGRDPRTVVLRWCWEANGNWYQHSIGPDKANFIEHWKRVMGIMRSAVGSVLGAGKSFMIEFGPAGHLRFGNGASERLWNIYPGDDVVDICGLGIHDQLGITTQADWDKYLYYPTTIAGTSFEGIIDWFDYATSRRKWLGTSEIESNYIARTYFPKTQNMDVMWRTGFERVRQRYDGRFVYFIYLWNGDSALKRADGWGEPYRLLYK
jgi:hypothetical protein